MLDAFVYIVGEIIWNQTQIGNLIIDGVSGRLHE